jgi:hypothetical protein
MASIQETIPRPPVRFLSPYAHLPADGRWEGSRSVARPTLGRWCHSPPARSGMSWLRGRAWQSLIAVAPDTAAHAPHPASEDRKGRADQVFNQDTWWSGSDGAVARRRLAALGLAAAPPPGAA